MVIFFRFEIFDLHHLLFASWSSYNIGILKRTVFNLANASHKCEETISWKPIPNSKYTLHPSGGPSWLGLVCWLVTSFILLFLFPHVSSSLTGIFGAQYHLAHFCLCSIVCNVNFISAWQMLFSMRKDKNQLLARSFKNSLYVWEKKVVVTLKIIQVFYNVNFITCSWVTTTGGGDSEPSSDLAISCLHAVGFLLII